MKSTCVSVTVMYVDGIVVSEVHKEILHAFTEANFPKRNVFGAVKTLCMRCNLECLLHVDRILVHFFFFIRAWGFILKTAFLPNSHSASPSAAPYVLARKGFLWQRDLFQMSPSPMSGQRTGFYLWRSVMITNTASATSKVWRSRVGVVL